MRGHSEMFEFLDEFFNPTTEMAERSVELEFHISEADAKEVVEEYLKDRKARQSADYLLRDHV